MIIKLIHFVVSQNVTSVIIIFSLFHIDDNLIRTNLKLKLGSNDNKTNYDDLKKKELKQNFTSL